MAFRHFTLSPMPLLDFLSLANRLPAAWSSQIVGSVGPARIKIVRMDAQPYAEETHAANEALLVLEGRLLLQMHGKSIVVEAGQMMLVGAGTPHAVQPGSSGVLVIIDV